MKTWTAFLIIAVVLFAFGGIGAWFAENTRVLIGGFIPGFICLIVALKLRENEARQKATRQQRPDEKRDEAP